MLRKLTLITMAIVLGLAVFAGCSNDAVTGSDTGSDIGQGKRVYFIEGTCSDSVGQPVVCAITIYHNGTPKTSELTDKEGYFKMPYSIYGTGSYTVTASLPSGEYETWEFSFPPGGDKYHNFYF